MPNDATRRYSVLVSSTLAFTVCIMIWMMFAVIGIPIKQTLGLSEAEFSLLTALPVLTGTLFRLPLSLWTERFGGRPVLFALMISIATPIYLVSIATELWQFLITGLFIGLAGGAFPVVFAYVTRRFPNNQPYVAGTLYSTGSVGTALTMLIAPLILVAWGWQAVPQIYAVLMSVTALLFLFTSHGDHRHQREQRITLQAHLAALKDFKVWRYGHYYAIVFGGYVALVLWLTKYYVYEYDFNIKSAALLATAFALPGGILHGIGDALTNKYGAHTVTWWVLWVSLLCLFFLSYPSSEFVVHTNSGSQRFSVGLGPAVFTALIFILGTAWAVGKAAVLKYISVDYPHNSAVIFDLVGLIGGLGGFAMLLMFGVIVDLTGIRSAVFMLMFGIIWVSLLWMYWTEVRPEKLASHERHQVTEAGAAGPRATS